MSATELARDVLQQLIDAGVTDVVVAPGSRNAPLSFAAYDAAQAGVLVLHTRTDERSAGFLAVGLARSHRRTAVICTSGTAVANLHPAALEAAHCALPVAFVTADRPGRLRGTDANQTTDQVGIFGSLLPTHDLSRPTPLDLGDDLDRPVHLNVQLDDPLLPTDTWRPEASSGWSMSWPDEALVVLPLGPRTVVVAGDDAGPAARRLAEGAGWPLLAEPSSGARTGDHALRCYRLLLDGDLGARIQRVVVLGRPTLSRPVSRLLARADVEVCSVPARGAWNQRSYPVAHEAPGYTAERDDPAWLEEWRAADRSVSRQLDALLAAEPALTPYDVAGAVSRAIAPGMQLVVGASSPVRDLDLMARPTPVGERRKVVANRGLAGIDGTVSTAIGAALGRVAGGHEGATVALMGDVTFLHDSNGLVLGPREARPDLMIVVVNDDGGSIFSMLEQGAPEHADRFETLFGTPHGVDLAALCAATRTPHLAVDSLPQLEQALAAPNGGIEVVEARVRRDDRRALDARIRTLRPDPS
ncbi:2-succinyl-5-enolpyruvyl-6-hydroxy-3-cyclohexene-1-carboxylic-acid synthase [Nocardioides plantarum]|uniref:2-succinyl-5-enolpyruvyl-6-hydroxy-3- cyclohexene-1-carboxylic-acid synthase n=1 Tax=Nocardioides plantarum TaxID=29299 RepID=UPI00111F7BDC|nr:2-succinyl-5-enolpyruvyl-6-hydroxy-3-cyclohexene-1-carboxylic-acid synthase [Nocardioides plantarum]